VRGLVPRAGGILRRVLHSLRKRLQDHAEREAAGESLWSPSFPEPARTRITYVLHQIVVTTGDDYATTKVFGEARRLIGSQIGAYTLAGDMKASDDFFTYYQRCDDDMFPTVLEALYRSLDALDESEAYSSYQQGYARQFAKGVNEIFAQERVGWEFIEGEMVEIHSKELHGAVVEPTLRLLRESRFAKADQQYRDALGELAQGKAANAITDTGTALQEVLEALGCEGNQLGDLTRSARKNGLLGAHDTPLIDAIEKTMHWVAADRSEMGDTHHATAATREDAWLIVHVVGALIVRLASGQPRRK
jgi:hypothetical protein